MTYFMVVPRPFMCMEMGSPLLGEEGFVFLSKALHLLHRSFVWLYPQSHSIQLRASVLCGYHTCFVTLLQRTIVMQDIHRTSVNAGFRSRLCPDLFYHPEMADSHGPRPDHCEVWAPYIWQLLVKLRIFLDLGDFGWRLPPSCIILLCHLTRKEF
jgi:hypothetical protein